METFLWTLGGILGSIAGVIALMAVIQPGPAILAAGFALVRDSRLAQWCAVAVAILIAALSMWRTARKQGAADALRDVQAATERAVESKREIDRQVERTPLQRKRDELGRWSK